MAQQAKKPREEEPAREQLLERELDETKKQLSELKSKYLYLYADFENFKKGVIRDRAELLKFGWEPVAKDLLENIDNLERAVAHMPPGTDRGMVEGLQLVLHQLKATLEQHGVKVIPVEKMAFDPEFHEAVAQVASDQPSGSIVEQSTTGYTMHGRLLRPARVVVSSGKSEEEEERK
jgi:molecular chaperone GrpE